MYKNIIKIGVSVLTIFIGIIVFLIVYKTINKKDYYEGEILGI